MHIVLDQNRIRVIDRFISPDCCREIIQLFEQDHARHTQRRGEWVNLVELSLAGTLESKNPLNRIRCQEWQPYLDHLTQEFFTAAASYDRAWGQVNGVRVLPQEFSMEGARVKCYRPNGVDQFKLHVDVADRASSSRFLSFLLYLNDSDAGTEFPLENLTIDAREGRLLMFPPLWTYPHAGLMPQRAETKYILSSYLHYI